MSSNETPLTERVSSYFSKLSAVAKDLNAVSDELGKSINEIDAALKKLNLGVSTWVTIYRKDIEPADNDFWQEHEQLGYAKVNGKWGICLRTSGHDVQNPDETRDEEWLFSDASREMRLTAIPKIPALLEALTNAAFETKLNLEGKLAEVQAVASAITKEKRVGPGAPINLTGKVVQQKS